MTVNFEMETALSLKKAKTTTGNTKKIKKTNPNFMSCSKEITEKTHANPSSSNFKRLTVGLICFISQAFQAEAPLSTPTLVVEGKSNDANWANTFTTAFTTVRKGSRLGTSRYVVYTSFEVTTTAGPTITMYDSQTATVDPTLSNTGLKITNHFASFKGGDNKFAVIDSGSTQSLVKILNNNFENSPTVLKTMPIPPVTPLSLLYDESSNTLVVGGINGVYKSDTSLDTPTYTIYTNIATGNNYYNLVKEITSGSTLAFAIGSNDKKLQNFDYSNVASALTNEITLSSPGSAIAQADRDSKKLLVGLDYSTGSKHLAYYADYTTGTLTSEEAFSANTADEVDYPYMWAMPNSENFYVALGQSVYLVEASATGITMTDKSSLFLSTSEGEILTSLVFFTDEKYLVAAGYKQDTYAFIKKMNFIGDCHTTCKTCSFGADETKCLTCPGDRYLYQPDAIISKCLLATECQAITDYYSNNSTRKCVSSTQCLTALRYLVEEWSDCVYVCPGTHEFVRAETSPTNFKECLTLKQCQDRGDYVTLREAKTCISNTACFAKPYVIIKDVSDCVAKCADDPLGLSLWKDGSNFCVTKTYCQHADRSPRSYTKNNTAGYECVTACAPSLKIVTYWNDCVTTCANYDPPLWEDGDNCITTEDCKAKTSPIGLTQIHTNKCVNPETCSTTDSNYVVTEASANLCVETCGVGDAATYNYKMTDPTPSTADTTFNKCYSDNGCKTDGFYRKHDTFECKTEDQCSADAATGIAWFMVKDSINDCIERCAEHPAGTHLYEDKTATKRTCVTKSNCNTASNFVDEVDKTCVSKTLCNDAPSSKYNDETDCMLTCATIGEYGTSLDKNCRTDVECKALADGSNFFLTKFSDNTCVTEAECKTASQFFAVGLGQCLENCDVETTTHIYIEPTDLKCYDEAGCKALGTHLVYKLSSFCWPVATCITTNSYYQIPETTECVQNCEDTDYKYIDLTDIALKKCRSEANCKTDKYTRKSDYKCVTAAECKTGSMYTTTTKECVSTCPTGEYKLELAAEYKCVTSANCIAQTTPSQHYMIDDDIMRCVTGTVCKGSDYNRFFEGTNHKCVFNCELQGGTKIFTDRTDGTCLTGTECQAVESGGTKVRSTFNETKECLTDTECTGTGSGQVDAFIVTEYRDCVRQCEDAYPDHALIDLDNPKNCLSPTQCTAASKYIREDKKLCLTAAQCKTANMFTTSDGYCVSECPASQYKLKLATEYKCVTATQCEAETTGEQHYKLDEGIMVCVTETDCTGTTSGQYSRWVVKDTKVCVHDCATQTTHFYTDETLKVCHSLASCQTFDSAGGSTPDRLAKRETKECITEATCTGGSFKMVKDTGKRLCIQACEEENSHTYLKGVSGTECVSKAQCNAVPGYTREKSQICMSSAECYTDSGYLVEATTGDGFGSCDDFCPSGEYKWTDGSSVNECITASECWTKNLYTDDEFDTCIASAACTSSSKLFMIDNESSAPKKRLCLAECSTHNTHKWKNGDVCLTGKECQDETDRFTQNSTFLCVSETTCTTTDSMVVNKENSLNDCTFTCPATLYKNATGNCITAAACQVDTPAETYTLNQTDPQNLCITKAECDAFGYFTIESFNDCRAGCPAKTETDDYLTYVPDKKCLTEDQCKATSNFYIFFEQSSCIDKAACTAFQFFTTAYDVSQCLANCPATYYAFNPSNEYECVTEADCLAKTAPIFVQKEDFKCFSKTECTTDLKFTQTGNTECLKNCPTDFYKLDTDNTCVDQTTCIGAPNNRYTFKTTQECILLATCTSRSMVAVEPDKDCICPENTRYYDKDDQVCLNSDDCTLKNKFTQNDTNVCLTEAQCVAMTPTAGAIVDTWSDCVTDCAVAGTLIFNLKRTTDPANRCVSSQMCKEYADGYVTDQNTCLKKAECTTQTLKSIEVSRECLADCANSATHKYTDDTDGICYTGIGCQQKSDRYTYNTTNKCVSKTFCNTDLTAFVIEDWSDCLAACPNVPGQHRFLDESIKTCFTGLQCQGRDGYYTQNTTQKCVDETTCVTTDSRKMIKEISDCVVDCAALDPYNYQFEANECVSKEACKIKTDGFYDDAVTPKTCIPKATCVAKPAFVVPSTSECLTPCPAGLFLDQNECLTQQECAAKGFYVDANASPTTCVVACPDPLFHDLTKLTCVTACPAELFTLTSERKCYTNAACLALSENHWIYPADKTCQSSCTLFKEEASRTCIAKTVCKDKALDSDSKCYIELSINDKKSGTDASEATDSEEKVKEVDRLSRKDQDSDLISIFFKIPIPVPKLASFVDNISYKISNDKLQGRRILQTGDISDFEFKDGTTAGQYQVQFNSPMNEEFLATVNFKQDVKVYYKAEGDTYPALYKLDLSSLTFTIPAQGSRNYTLIEGVVMAYDGVLKTVPVIGNLFSMISSTRFMPFASDNYNKIVAYSRSKSLNIIDEDYKESHNFTFVDWTGRFNKLAMSNWVSTKIVAEDIQKVCEKPERQSCYKRINANFLINKSVFMLIFILFLVFLTKRRVKFGILPTLWFTFQYLVNLDLIHNIGFFEFSGTFHIIGLILSIILLLTVIVIFLMRFTLNKSKDGENYKHDVFQNVFFQIFASKERMGEFFMVKFVTGLLISAAVETLSTSPKIQGIILVVLELATVGSTFRGYFKLKIFNVWNILTSILFLILAVFTLLLAFSNRSTSSIIDTLAYFTFWVIITIDIIWIIISFWYLKYEFDTPYKGVARQVPKAIPVNSQPTPSKPTVIQGKVETGRKRDEEALSNNVSKNDGANSFMMNGRTVTYTKKKRNRNNPNSSNRSNQNQNQSQVRNTGQNSSNNGSYI